MIPQYRARAGLLLTLALSSLACSGDLQCTPEHESAITAIHLGELQDTADASLPYSGTLDSCNNDVYLHFRGHDDSLFDSNKAGLTVGYDDHQGVDALESCIYVACHEGGTKVQTCDAGDVDYFPISSEWGQPGCCRKGPGALDLTYSCDSGLTQFLNSAGADFYVHLCPTQVGGSSIDYQGEVHF